MILIVGLIFFTSFILAAWSLRDYNGERGVGDIHKAHRKDSVKGSIIFYKDKKSTHYSSYSL